MEIFFGYRLVREPRPRFSFSRSESLQSPTGGEIPGMHMLAHNLCQQWGAYMATDAKLQVKKLESKIEALKKKRETKLAKADKEFEKSRREAVNRHNGSYKQVLHEYDPKIAKLEEKRKTADRKARQVWEDLQNAKAPAKR